jgi:hypothetical protein
MGSYNQWRPPVDSIKIADKPTLLWLELPPVKPKCIDNLIRSPTAKCRRVDPQGKPLDRDLLLSHTAPDEGVLFVISKVWKLCLFLKVRIGDWDRALQYLVLFRTGGNGG